MGITKPFGSYTSRPAPGDVSGTMFATGRGRLLASPDDQTLTIRVLQDKPLGLSPGVVALDPVSAVLAQRRKTVARTRRRDQPFDGAKHVEPVWHVVRHG